MVGGVGCNRILEYSKKVQETLIKEFFLECMNALILSDKFFWFFLGGGVYVH